ncbi:MAG: hypothetical protein QM743_10160 [Chitinophagaceae bacterium]
MKTFILPILLSCCAAPAVAQSSLQIPSGVRVPKEQQLIGKLDAFLLAADKDNEANPWVLPAERATTFVQLDELKEIRYNPARNDSNFYKPCLMNIVSMKGRRYWIQVAYIGYANDSVQLRASFDFIAQASGDSFLFSSPLGYLSRNWKTKRVGNTTFRYPAGLNSRSLEAYRHYTDLYDAKLHTADKQQTIYCCAGTIELQRLAGVTYKSDYNGRSSGAWATMDGNSKLVLQANDSYAYFDPHDHWHERLSMAVARSKTNRPVDEACAYLYGGSWGMGWPAIYKAFKEQVAAHPETDWAALKEQPVFFKTGDYSNSADYIVNALWVKKIEREKGFAGVWTLLNCGPYAKGNEQYYKTLEALTGTTRAGYNDAVWELIRREQD